MKKASAGRRRDRSHVWIALVLLLAGLVWVTRTKLVRPVRIDESSAPAVDDAERIEQRINLNQASAAELSLLPGVGPQLAQRIVDHRTEFGAFHRLEDLAEVSGIGKRTIERVRPHVRVEP